MKNAAKSSGGTVLLTRPATVKRRRVQRTGIRIAGLAVSDADTASPSVRCWTAWG